MSYRKKSLASAHVGRKLGAALSSAVLVAPTVMAAVPQMAWAAGEVTVSGVTAYATLGNDYTWINTNTGKVSVTKTGENKWTVTGDATGLGTDDSQTALGFSGTAKLIALKIDTGLSTDAGLYYKDNGGSWAAYGAAVPNAVDADDGNLVVVLPFDGTMNGTNGKTLGINTSAADDGAVTITLKSQASVLVSANDAEITGAQGTPGAVTTGSKYISGTASSTITVLDGAEAKYDGTKVTFSAKTGYENLVVTINGTTQSLTSGKFEWTPATGADIVASATAQSTTSANVSYYVDGSTSTATDTTALGNDAGWEITNPTKTDGTILVGWSEDKNAVVKNGAVYKSDGTTAETALNRKWEVDIDEGVTKVAEKTDLSAYKPYGVWSKAFAVKYDLAGGEFDEDVDDIESYVDDNFASAHNTVTSKTAANITREGYVFKGWTVTANNRTFKVSASNTLNDQLTEVKADGTEDGSAKVTIDGKEVKASLGNLATLYGDLSLVAQWNQKVTVKFYDGAKAATNVADKEIELDETSGTAISTYADAPAAKGTFIGWATEDGGTALTTVKELAAAVKDKPSLVSAGVVELYAVYAAEDSGSVTYVINAPEDFPSANIDKDWVNTTKAGNSVATTPIKTAAYDGHKVFNGWNTKADGTGAHIGVGENSPGWLTQAAYDGGTTLFGEWVDTYNLVYVTSTDKGAKYNETVVTGGGTPTYVKADSLTVATPTLTKDDTNKNAPAGYSLSAWVSASGKRYQAGDKVDPADANEDGVITLTADYSKKDVTFRIALNAGTGGTGRMNTLEFKTGDGKTLPASTFKNANGKFVGWAKNAGGKVIIADEGSHAILDKDITAENTVVNLYAVWAEKYTIEYDANDANYAKAPAAKGKTAATAAVAGEKADLAANGFTREGWTFVGWVLQADADKKAVLLDSTDYVSSTADLDDETNNHKVKVYAIWREGTDPAESKDELKKGWYKDDKGLWHYNDVKGEQPTDHKGWLETTPGTWYYFGSDGVMYKEKWLQSKTTKLWYYFGSDGKMYKSRGAKLKDHWYWFKDKGMAAQNETIASGYTYDVHGWWTAYEASKK